MTEGGAGKKAEKPERARRVGGGTAEGTGNARQADTAREGDAGEGAPMLMEEVCARQNLMAAHRRVVRRRHDYAKRQAFSSLVLAGPQGVAA